MRISFARTFASVRPASDGTWVPGLAHVLGAAATWPVMGGAACAAGLLMASLVSFVVWLPLTALALNGGDALAPDSAAPELTGKAKWTLFAAWTATAWLAAAIARQGMIGSG